MPEPPPRCPKCGSHRTEIVGFSTDRLTVVIRCTICGERSKLNAMPEKPSKRHLACLVAAAG